MRVCDNCKGRIDDRFGYASATICPPVTGMDVFTIDLCIQCVIVAAKALGHKQITNAVGPAAASPSGALTPEEIAELERE